MPIKGISDRYRMPILGTIHIGEPKPERGNQFPKSIDYFRFPEGVNQPFGEKPSVIEIVFPVNDLEWCCSQWYKRWGGTRKAEDAVLLCRGDGETATRLDIKTGEMTEVECLGRECEYYQAEKCIQQGWLKFLLPTVPGLGIWQIYTKSYHSMVNINSMLMTFVNTGKPFAGIPFLLRVEMETSVQEGQRRRYPVLSLHQQHISFAELTAKAGQRQLPVPGSLQGMEETRPDDLIATRNHSDNAEPSEESKSKVETDREAARKRAEQNGQTEGAGTERVRRTKSPF